VSELTHADWAAAAGTEFTIAAVVDSVTGESSEQTLELHEVSDLREQAGFWSWSLVFRGPAVARFDQGTALLRHRVLGELAVFLVPVGIDDDIATYESVFSVAAQR
jgi:hypothetical protein